MVTHVLDVLKPGAHSPVTTGSGMHVASALAAASGGRHDLLDTWIEEDGRSYPNTLRWRESAEHKAMA